MKVIFVASGNKKGTGQVSSFVQSQYDSLRAEGLEMVLFPVVGHGAMAHMKAVWQLRKLVKSEKPDVIHAHYSIYGYVASIACLGIRRKPKIVVSILGSFPKRNKKWRLVRYCVQHIWDKTLVKSERTKRQLGLDVPVIPNGVNLDVFKLMDYSTARTRVGFDSNDQSQMTNHKYVIWCSNPERPEKDWALAQAAVQKCQMTNDKSQISLIAVFGKTPDEVMAYMNAADCLLLTSVSEGSPNVIKEAMACNCPIVTTDVGDVTERLHNLDGCYVVPERMKELKNERVRDVADALKKALEFGKRTEGRKRIIEDELEIGQVAKRIIMVYNELKN